MTSSNFVVGRRALLAFALLVSTASAAMAQEPADSAPPARNGVGGLLDRAFDFSGTVTMFAEAYGVQGVQARRPSSSWRMALSPQLSMLGSMSLGINALVSSEGSELRQNLSQFGLNPRWRWGAAHVGDFSQAFSPYTIQGMRLRGAGLELRPGLFRVALQGGRAQRSVPVGLDGPVYKRQVIGGRVGIGRESSSFVDLTLLKVKDDPASVETGLLVTDSILLDTLPEFLRPRVETRPQENLVLALAGQLSLFRQMLLVKGEVAGSLLTHDMEAARAKPPESVGILEVLDPLHPIRLSTSADYSYNIDAALRQAGFSLQGGYEYVGTGYASLGLPYLINDRESYRFAGSTRLFSGRIMLQGQYQHQHDNLLGQKRATTNRDVGAASVAFRLFSNLTATFSGVGNIIANDAASDTFRVDTRTLALNANLSAQRQLFGKATSLGLSYGYQESSDANPVFRVPTVTAHNVTTSLQMSLGGVSIGPSVSAAIREIEGSESEENVFLGLRGQARLFEDRLDAALNVSRTFSQGREVFSALSNLGWRLPWETRLSFQVRYSDYSAFGPRPAFREEFVTLSVTRSF